MKKVSKINQCLSFRRLWLYCLAVILFFTFNSFNSKDFGKGCYVVYGKVFEGKKLLTNKKLKLLYHFQDKNLEQESDSQFIHTDSLGNFSTTIYFVTPCPSGDFSKTCPGLTEVECLNKNARAINPNYIGLVYKSKETQFQNDFMRVIDGKHFRDTLKIKRDIQFP
jgi:hypothetical protein